MFSKKNKNKKLDSNGYTRFQNVFFSVLTTLAILFALFVVLGGNQ